MNNNNINYQELLQALNSMMSNSMGKSNMSGMFSNMGGGSSGGNNGLLGMIGQGVESFGNTLEAIDKMTTKPRRPLEETVGLYSFDGKKLYDIGGFMQAGSTMMDLIGNAVNQAKIENTDDLKKQIKSFGNTNLKVNDLDSLSDSWANRTELQHLKTRDLRNKTVFGDIANSIAASGKGFSAGSSFGPAGAAVGGVVGGVSSLIGSIIGRVNAVNERKRVNRLSNIANAKNLLAYENKASDIDIQNDLNALANYSAFGGPIFNQFSAGGGIYIKPENRGKFTALKERTGKSSTWFKEHGTPAQKKMATFALNAAKWHHGNGGPLTGEQYYGIMENVAEQNYRRWGFNNPDLALLHALNDNTYNYRGYYNKYPNSDADASSHWTDEFKTAYHPTFSDESIYSGKKSQYNPRGIIGGHWVGEMFIPEKWQPREDFIKPSSKKHQNGGALHTQGSIWDNGITFINNGGTHQENPMEGVQVSVDPNGIPNLVEEGEVIWNDYVFSNRLKADKNLLTEFNLPKSQNNKTFANIAKNLSKESQERPNDPISRRGLDDFMSKLQQAQETIRAKQNKGNNNDKKLFALGGPQGIDPDLLYNDEDVVIVPTGTKIMNPHAEDYSGYTSGTKSSTTDKEDDDTKSNNNKRNWLRYAPALGSAIGVMSNLLSRPDYSNASRISGAASDAGNYMTIGYKPVGNYLQYTPFDRDFYINKLNAQASATRRAIMNSTNPSRNAALLAADYNALGRLGDLSRQAEEYNLAQRQAVENFNRGTNMANSEMGLKAAMANQSTRQQAMATKLQGIVEAARMREEIDRSRSAALSANMSNLFDNLGNIGIDQANREDTKFAIKNKLSGNLPIDEFAKWASPEETKKEMKERGFSDSEIEKYFEKNNLITKKSKKKKGGNNG